ncbi:hypothetical protein BQ9231_00444 [Cedratvirus lausannensis]|uniref:Uncharacterized protein n=1 Tax=Cedratvirus lausannensis TaxID=2023205 RepID=A0A285PYL6_9VIRU|nr:hypothetical protein BQ9231_00444 [Cedratvirus lausannensis]
MAQSLYSTVLKNYTYDDLKELCFAPGSTFTNVFECDWRIWRDKAAADFGISPQFFDLVRSLSGPQRYLQIASYVKLTPLSLAGWYDDETCPCFIEGVYEAYAGYREAKERRDGDMMLWFAQRVTPEEDFALGGKSTFARAKEERQSWSGGLLKDLHHPRRYDVHYLSLVVRHGRVDILDDIIHRYFTLPKEFSIVDLDKGGLEGPFPLYDLPLQTTSDEDVIELLESALSSGDVRIVDFFRSIFRDRDLVRMASQIRFLSDSLLIHGKPEEAYKIALRFMDADISIYRLSYMVELVLHQMEKKGSFWRLLPDNLGNITFIQALLTYVDKEQVRFLLEEDFTGVEHTLYPLSVSLLQDYVE